MPRPILFAIGQAGSAEYLLPLWRRWLAEEPKPRWRVAASPPARRRIAEAGLSGVPLIECGDCSAGALAGALGGWGPDLVFDAASGASVESACVALGRGVGAPIVCLIDVWYGYRERVSANGHDRPAAVLVIDDEAAREAAAEGISPEIIVPVGHPWWEEVASAPCPPAADRRHIMFASQPIERFHGRTLGYTERDAWRMLVETARLRPDLVSRLIFAPHPDDDMRPPAADRLVRVARGRDALADVGTVVSMFSSLMTDALLAGRHVVSLQPGAVGADRSRMGRERLVARATGPDELAVALAAPAPEPRALREALAGSCARLERVLLSVPNV